MSRNMQSRVQVAHFLEADLQPWAALLTAALFTASPPAAQREAAWGRLDELAPLGDTISTVLRASRLPLRQQLPLTPVEWQPAVIGSHVVAGALTLDFAEAAACCDAMHAVQQVHVLSLHLPRSINDSLVGAEEAVLLQVRTAVASLPALRSLSVSTTTGAVRDGLPLLLPALSHLSRLESLTWSHNGCNSCRYEPGPARDIARAAWAALAPQLRRLTTLTALDLSNNALYKVEMQALAPALSCLVRLEHLSLHGNGLEDPGAQALGPSLRHLTALTALDLGNNQIDTRGAEALEPAWNGLVRLQSLNLCRNFMFEGDWFEPGPGLHQLTSLDLSYNNIGNNDVEYLAHILRHFSQLAHLNLRSN